ncbi:MAG: F0F1 ATP synthase subunit epsilon [Gemmatimonadales bacterium]
MTVVSPERALFDGAAESVVAPAVDGLVGILPRHAPFMTLLGDGVVAVRRDEGTTRFRVFGGFLRVVGEAVWVVADRVETA